MATTILSILCGLLFLTCVFELVALIFLNKTDNDTIETINHNYLNSKKELIEKVDDFQNKCNKMSNDYMLLEKKCRELEKTNNDLAQKTAEATTRKVVEYEIDRRRIDRICVTTVVPLELLECESLDKCLEKDLKDKLWELMKDRAEINCELDRIRKNRVYNYIWCVGDMK